eukprot:3244781-Pleurochrysis_carterae.AAC.1
MAPRKSLSQGQTPFLPFSSLLWPSQELMQAVAAVSMSALTLPWDPSPSRRGRVACVLRVIAERDAEASSVTSGSAPRIRQFGYPRISSLITL